MFSFSVVHLLMCQVGLSCQLSLNQPAECREFRRLLHFLGLTVAERASPTFEMIVRSIIRNVGYDDARSVPSIQRSAFIFLIWKKKQTKKNQPNNLNNETLLDDLYLLFIYVLRGRTSPGWAAAYHIFVLLMSHESLLQSCLFWNAGEYAHIECIESCLLSRSFSTRTICTPSRVGPPALCTSSISWLFCFFC